MPAIAGVKQVRKRLADGTVKLFYYHRATMQRLPDDPASAAFATALTRLDREAETQALIGERNLFSLIRQYCNAPDWKDLAASTRAIEAFNLKAIEDEFGDMPLAAIEERGARSEFLAWRDAMADATPRAADAKLARLARVLAFGVDRELLLVNPLATFKRVYKSDRAEIIWLPEHVRAFNAVASPALQVALVVALHTGQRRGDLLRLTWNNYDGRAISLTQSKTGAHVYIPCTTALKTTLDQLPRKAVQIITSTQGRPWTENGFSTAWERAFEKTRLREDLHFHDLRGTAVTMLAEAGCTTPEIATITGHSLVSVDKILGKYLARTRTLAESAIAKLELRTRTNREK